MPLQRLRVSFGGELSCSVHGACDIKSSLSEQTGFFCACPFLKSWFQSVLGCILEAFSQTHLKCFLFVCFFYWRDVSGCGEAFMDFRMVHRIMYLNKVSCSGHLPPGVFLLFVQVHAFNKTPGDSNTSIVHKPPHGGCKGICTEKTQFWNQASSCTRIGVLRKLPMFSEF